MKNKEYSYLIAFQTYKCGQLISTGNSRIIKKTPISSADCSVGGEVYEFLLKDEPKGIDFVCILSIYEFKGE